MEFSQNLDIEIIAVNANHPEIDEATIKNKPSQQPHNHSTLEKNNQIWEAMKTDIFKIYVEEKCTLETTMDRIEKKYGFSARCVRPSFRSKLLSSLIVI